MPIKRKHADIKSSKTPAASKSSMEPTKASPSPTPDKANEPKPAKNGSKLTELGNPDVPPATSVTTIPKKTIPLGPITRSNPIFETIGLDGLKVKSTAITSVEEAMEFELEVSAQLVKHLTCKTVGCCGKLEVCTPRTLFKYKHIEANCKECDSRRRISTLLENTKFKLTKDALKSLAEAAVKATKEYEKTNEPWLAELAELRRQLDEAKKLINFKDETIQDLTKGKEEMRATVENHKREIEELKTNLHGAIQMIYQLQEKRNTPDNQQGDVLQETLTPTQEKTTPTAETEEAITTQPPTTSSFAAKVKNGNTNPTGHGKKTQKIAPEIYFANPFKKTITAMKFYRLYMEIQLPRMRNTATLMGSINWFRGWLRAKDLHSKVKDFSFVGKSYVELYVPEITLEETKRTIQTLGGCIVSDFNTMSQDINNVSAIDKKTNIARRLLALYKRNPLQEMRRTILQGYPAVIIEEIEKKMREANMGELPNYIQEVKEFRQLNQDANHPSSENPTQC